MKKVFCERDRFNWTYHHVRDLRRRGAAAIRRRRYHYREIDRGSIHYVTCPETFALTADPAAFCRFVDRLKADARRGRKVIGIDLSNISTLNHDALYCLLAVLSKLNSKHQCQFVSKQPRNLRIRNLLHQSNFYNYGMKHSLPEKSQSRAYIIRNNEGSETSIVAGIFQELMNISGCIAIETLARSYGMVIEAMTNTAMHARLGVASTGANLERWFLFVYHDHSEKKFIFTFIDNGTGIISTLKKKLLERFDPAELLRAVFNGEINRTATSQSFHGRGLPFFNRCATTAKEIRNFVVLTQSVVGYPERNEFVQMSSSFEGTVIRWEHYYE